MPEDKPALEDRLPDFTGTWVAERFFYPIGLFAMYIQKREPLGEGKESISGIITDRYGFADFKGTLSNEEIEFVKTYWPEAIERGAANNWVEYAGRNAGFFYAGTYIVVQGVSGGITREETRKFIMEKYHDPRLN